MMGDAPTLQQFFDGWILFREPVLTGALAGAALGVVGVYIVLRRLVFLTAAVTQTAGLGVALSFWSVLHLGLPRSVASPTLWAIAAIGLTLAAVLRPARARGASTDGRMGVAFLLGGAGTLLVGTRILEELQDIESLLFGTAVAVLPEDFHATAGVAVGVLLLHAWWWRGFEAVSFDREGASVRGMPVRLLDVALFASFAVAVAITTRVLGALPAFAFCVLPAHAATRIAPNLRVALVLSAALGAVTGFGGYLLAFLYELPVGATQTALGCALVGVSRVPDLFNWRPSR